MAIDDLAVYFAFAVSAYNTLVVGVSIYLVTHLICAVYDVIWDINETGMNCNELAEHVQLTAWCPLTVAVIASYFGITQDEV
uniref:CASP-like protein n=1 Tax=Heterorhabditis bacteriophora TaxID=37862 RepID=A0A1I7X589_HETBA